MWLQTFLLMKSASEQLSEMSRECSAVVLIKWELRNSGGTQAKPSWWGPPSCHTAGCWCPSDLGVQGATRTDKHMLLACRKAWQMSEGLAVMLLAPEVWVSKGCRVQCWFSILGFEGEVCLFCSPHSHWFYMGLWELYLGAPKRRAGSLPDVCHTCQGSQTTAVLCRNREGKVK